MLLVLDFALGWMRDLYCRELNFFLFCFCKKQKRLFLRVVKMPKYGFSSIGLNVVLRFYKLRTYGLLS